jgi:hypothetical protein
MLTRLSHVANTIVASRLGDKLGDLHKDPCLEELIPRPESRNRMEGLE